MTFKVEGEPPFLISQGCDLREPCRHMAGKLNTGGTEMAYMSYDELVKGVKKDYPIKTTADRLEKGLNRVAPPGKEANPDVCELYEKRTDEDAAVRMVEHWSASRLFRPR